MFLEGMMDSIIIIILHLQRHTNAEEMQQRHSFLSFPPGMDNIWPIPVAAWSKPKVCDRALGGNEGCPVEVSASSWSLVQRSPNECGVSEFEREALIMRGTLAY